MKLVWECEQSIFEKNIYILWCVIYSINLQPTHGITTPDIRDTFSFDGGKIRKKYRRNALDFGHMKKLTKLYAETHIYHWRLSHEWI